MPDWIAHLGFAFLLAYALKIKRKEPVVIGALVPDIVRVFEFLPVFGNSTFFAALPFHGLLLPLFISGIICAFFIEGISYKKGLALMYLGVLTHLFLDGLMLYTIAGVRALIPFSFLRFGALNIVPSEDFSLAILAVIIIAVVVIYELLKRKQSKGAEQIKSD